MFELKVYRCPNCGAEIRDELSDGQEYDCFNCRRLSRLEACTPISRALA